MYKIFYYVKIFTMYKILLQCKICFTIYKILYKKLHRLYKNLQKRKKCRKLADRRKYRERVYINKVEKETFPKEKKRKRRLYWKGSEGLLILLPSNKIEEKAFSQTCEAVIMGK